MVAESVFNQCIILQSQDGNVSIDVQDYIGRMNLNNITDERKVF